MRLNLDIARVTLLRNKHSMDKIYFHLTDYDTQRVSDASGGDIGGGTLEMYVPWNTGENVLEMLEIPEGRIELIAMSEG